MMGTSTQVETQGTPGGVTVRPRGLRVPLTWLLLSLVMAALVALVILSLVIGIGLSNRVDDLEGEIPGLADDSQVVNALLQLRVLSYWLAYPTTEALLLEPPSGTGNAQGVLRTANDGLSAMLMLAGMQELPPPSVYQVWLTSEEQRVQAGQLRVDPSGWGATTIYLVEPISGFDTVEVTLENADGLGAAPGLRVLEAKIVLDSDSE